MRRNDAENRSQCPPLARCNLLASFFFLFQLGFVFQPFLRPFSSKRRQGYRSTSIVRGRDWSRRIFFICLVPITNIFFFSFVTSDKTRYVKVFRNRARRHIIDCPSCSLGRLGRKGRKGGRNKWHLGGSIYRFIWISRPLVETLSLLLILPPPSPFCGECFTFVVVVRTADIFSSVSSLNAFRWKSLLYYNTIFPLLPSFSIHESRKKVLFKRRFLPSSSSLLFFEDGIGGEESLVSIFERCIRWRRIGWIWRWRSDKSSCFSREFASKLGYISLIPTDLSPQLSLTNAKNRIKSWDEIITRLFTNYGNRRRMEISMQMSRMYSIFVALSMHITARIIGRTVESKLAVDLPTVSPRDLQLSLPKIPHAIFKVCTSISYVCFHVVRTQYRRIFTLFLSSKIIPVFISTLKIVLSLVRFI